MVVVVKLFHVEQNENPNKFLNQGPLWTIIVPNFKRHNKRGGNLRQSGSTTINLFVSFRESTYDRRPLSVRRISVSCGIRKNKICSSVRRDIRRTDVLVSLPNYSDWCSLETHAYTPLPYSSYNQTLHTGISKTFFNFRRT